MNPISERLNPEIESTPFPWAKWTAAALCVVLFPVVYLGMVTMILHFGGSGAPEVEQFLLDTMRVPAIGIGIFGGICFGFLVLIQWR